jgi:hypothetical protein
LPNVRNAPSTNLKTLIRGCGGISWPGHIDDPGGIRTQFHHIIDIAICFDGVAGRSLGNPYSRQVSFAFLYEHGASIALKAFMECWKLRSRQRESRMSLILDASTPPEPNRVRMVGITAQS